MENRTESTKEIQETEEIRKDHEELEEFLRWLEALCVKKGTRLYGVRKLDMGGRKAYIGFLLETKKSEWHMDKTHEYAIYGFLNSPRSTQPEYEAHLYQRLSEVPTGITNKMWLDDNTVQRSSRRYGIGSIGLGLIKDLCYQLHCTVIEGSMQTERLTEEETEGLTEEEVAKLRLEKLEDLRRFYAKNGFRTEKDSKYIMCTGDRIPLDPDNLKIEKICPPKLGIVTEANKYQSSVNDSITENRNDMTPLERELFAISAAMLIRMGRESDLMEALHDPDKRKLLIREMGL